MLACHRSSSSTNLGIDPPPHAAQFSDLWRKDHIEVHPQCSKRVNPSIMNPSSTYVSGRAAFPFGVNIMPALFGPKRHSSPRQSQELLPGSQIDLQLGSSPLYCPRQGQHMYQDVSPLIVVPKQSNHPDMKTPQPPASMSSNRRPDPRYQPLQHRCQIPIDDRGVSSKTTI